MTEMQPCFNRVTFIRRRVLQAVVEHEPAQWTWEIAISGRPDGESGMIVPLADVDGFLSQQTMMIKNYDISSGAQWLADCAHAFQRVIQNNAGTTPRLEWQRLISPSIIFQWHAPRDSQ
jgi:hypothetical protein